MNQDFVSNYPYVYVFFLALSYYTTHIFYKTTLKYKESRKKHIMGAYSIMVVLSTMLMLESIGLHEEFNSAISMVFSIFIVLFYESTIQKKLFYALSLWVLFTCSEFMVIFSYVFIFDSSVETVFENDNLIFFLYALSKFFPFLLISYISTLWKKKNISEQDGLLPFFQGIQFIVIPVISVVVLSTSYQYQEENKDFSVIVTCLGIILLNVIYFSLFEALNQSTRKEYEKQLLEKEVGYYEELYSTVKQEQKAIETLRHNIKNDLISLKATIEQGSKEELLSELQKLLDISSIESQKISPVPIVDAVVSYKMTMATNSKVKIEPSITIGKALKMNNSCLANILGNALDNAIEYCAGNLSEGDRVIQCVLRKTDQNLFISISNQYVGEIYLDDGLPYSSKRNRKTHGIGLSTIRSLTEELGGLFSLDLQNQIFTVEVILFDVFD